MTNSRHLFDFRRAGEDLQRHGCNNIHSGNMSVRDEGSIIITKRGAKLGRIGWDDLVSTSLHCIDGMAAQASTELIVHRAVYQNTPYKALVHAHPPHAVALSFGTDWIEPIDAEGRYYLPRVPIMNVHQAISSDEVAATLPQALRSAPLVIVRGHGSFAAGNDLERCLLLTSSLESACKIAFLASVAETHSGKLRR